MADDVAVHAMHPYAGIIGNGRVREEHELITGLEVVDHSGAVAEHRSVNGGEEVVGVLGPQIRSGSSSRHGSNITTDPSEIRRTRSTLDPAPPPGL